MAKSLTRQILVSKRAYKQLYGIDVRIGWNPDSFGYNWQLPQILQEGRGIDYFVTQKNVVERDQPASSEAVLGGKSAGRQQGAELFS